VNDATGTFKKRYCKDYQTVRQAVSRICCKKALYPIISHFPPCQDIFFLSAIPRLCLSISPPQVLSTIVRLETILLLCQLFVHLFQYVRCFHPSPMLFRKRLVGVKIHLLLFLPLSKVLLFCIYQFFHLSPYSSSHRQRDMVFLVQCWGKGKRRGRGYKIPDDVYYGEMVEKHPDKKEQKLMFFLFKNRGALQCFLLYNLVWGLGLRKQDISMLCQMDTIGKKDVE